MKSFWILVLACSVAILSIGVIAYGMGGYGGYRGGFGGQGMVGYGTGYGGQSGWFNGMGMRWNGGASNSYSGRPGRGYYRGGCPMWDGQGFGTLPNYGNRRGW